MKTRQRRFSIKQVLKYAVQISEFLAQIHAAGWVWRDCKPDNIIITQDGFLRPLDFEGAFPSNSREMSFWRTMEYSPPEGAEYFSGQPSEFPDLYALGAVVYFLFTGKIYQPDSATPIKKLRRNVPAPVRETIRQLLCLDSVIRPSAKEAAFTFNKSLKPIE
jgi:serine/threonine protein kinase